MNLCSLIKSEVIPPPPIEVPRNTPNQILNFDAFKELVKHYLSKFI